MIEPKGVVGISEFVGSLLEMQGMVTPELWLVVSELRSDKHCVCNLWSLSKLWMVRVKSNCSCHKKRNLLYQPWLTETCSLGRENMKGQRMRNFWFLGGYLVTHDKKLHLCCDSLLKIKLIEWDLEIVVDPTPNEIAHWIHKEIQNNKKQTKHIIPWWLLCVIAKMKVIESAGADSGAGPSLDFSQSEL